MLMMSSPEHQSWNSDADPSKLRAKSQQAQWRALTQQEEYVQFLESTYSSFQTETHNDFNILYNRLRAAHGRLEFPAFYSFESCVI
jgi:hypothetical protein